MKIYLCLAILYKLMQGKRVSASALSKEFEVSVRTIYRNIDALSLAGFLIVSYFGKNGGYELLSDCSSLVGFSSSDVEIIKNAVLLLPKNEKNIALSEKLNAIKIK